MSARRPATIAVVFGGRSVEHDVSIVTASQIMRALDSSRHEIVPVYISRNGRWFGGEPLLELANFDGDVTAQSRVYPVLLSPGTQHHGLLLQPLAGRLRRSSLQRIDVVFPALHGTHGEDGTLQGLLELADIPYVGCLTLGSALANDKISARALLQQHDIPLVPALEVQRSEWLEAPDKVLARITRALEWPLFIKPATTGSSIGIGRADNEALLRASIDVAAHFDRRILVEQGITGHVEINCSVLGNSPDLRASALEQPLSWDEFLTYDEKYLQGPEGMKNAGRIITRPAGRGANAANPGAGPASLSCHRRPRHRPHRLLRQAGRGGHLAGRDQHHARLAGRLAVAGERTVFQRAGGGADRAGARCSRRKATQQL